MAELDTSGGGHKKGPGVKKGKKLSTRVDLTPMVDLGFLLITFFIFTTTMSQPTAFKLFLPDDKVIPEDQNKAKESGVLTIMMGADNHIYYYEGQLKPDGSNFLSASYNGENSIREIILKKKADVISRSRDAENPEKDFVVVIKPSADCNYQNVVDILDEMAINVVKKYALVDISEGEAQLVSISDKTSQSPTSN
ncbi:MAG: biopolymer transporter ExbD [Crocinitomicaceae bacterium]|jgi:biopolymer transport protein ExbD|nr:biopolymer transporter ExbD [Sediminibacterium sp.]MCF8411337.1 biopolymer transporter ExbD [Crocinitomicaceae bacterium]